MTFYPSYIRAQMLLSYKWDWVGYGLGWKSLCGATIRASLCDANNRFGCSKPLYGYLKLTKAEPYILHLSRAKSVNARSTQKQQDTSRSVPKSFPKTLSENSPKSVIEKYFEKCNQKVFTQILNQFLGVWTSSIGLKAEPAWLKLYPALLKP